MEGTGYLTKEAALRRAQEAIGIPLRQIDRTGRLATGKGAVGTVLEESWFGYSPNSESAADLPEAGVELKATPYLRTARGIRAKERLVCNMIDYMTEPEKTFETSDFWKKCRDMLIMSYEHRPDVPKGDFTVDKAVLFSFPEEDLAIIRQDWEKIMAKIRSGQAHLLSEGDTMYLGACTKAADSSAVRRQPYSQIPAKPRAYALKSAYMTRLLERYIFGREEDPRIVKDWRELRDRTFEEYIVSRVSPYYGKTQQELKELFGIDSTAKSLNDRLLARMLGIRGRIADTEEFRKAGIVPKTVRIQRGGTVRESMSFPTFDFIRLSGEEVWEESELYEQLAPTRFMFVIFREEDEGRYVFSEIRFWNIPNEDLEEVKAVWERTVRTLRRGVRLIPTPRGMGNDLPKQADSPVAHVRPHGRDAADTLPLPDGRRMTKQCFWLNRSYVEKILGLR